MNLRTAILGRTRLSTRGDTGRSSVRLLGSVAVLATAVMLGHPAANAFSASLVTGKQIKDGSITGLDIRDHSVGAREFGHLPAGPQGPVGPPGAPGPQGPQGAPGSSGWVTVVGDAVAVTDIASADAKCPGGTKAVGGGVRTSDATVAELKESGPYDVDGTGWLGTVRNISSSLPRQPLSISAWVVCVTVTP
jgi:hypothetical protein